MSNSDYVHVSFMARSGRSPIGQRAEGVSPFAPSAIRHEAKFAELFTNPLKIRASGSFSPEAADVMHPRAGTADEFE